MPHSVFYDGTKKHALMENFIPQNFLTHIHLKLYKMEKWRNENFKESVKRCCYFFAFDLTKRLNIFYKHQKNMETFELSDTEKLRIV